ncbi:uncharacterized protein LOC111446232 [Cucurbita moschata]|uniref:Uncharacterized protein LOC111446232 n=1 Tax=Cucurbita moschata TaxID=3662 RepID=A0A6J1FJ97_CUCMO|nr:uncharacterized protein LOC111446232 [Cucurbita moschata]
MCQSSRGSPKRGRHEAMCDRSYRRRSFHGQSQNGHQSRYHSDARGLHIYIFLPRCHSLLQHILTEFSINGLLPLECSFDHYQAIGGRESRIIERSFWPRLGDEKQRSRGGRRTLYVIEIGYMITERGRTLALDEVIVGAKLKQLVLSLWPVGFWHLLGRLDGLVHVKFVANSYRCIKYSHSIHRDGNGGCR